MYKKNNAYNKASGKTFERLLPGGYVIGFVLAEETYSSKNKPMLKCQIEIVEGERKFWFTNQMRSSTNGKWPVAGMYYVVLPADDANEGDPTLNRFKHFMELMENNNPTVQFWNPDDTLNAKAFRGAKIGAIFGDEEYVAQSGINAGSLRTAVKISSLVDINDITSGNYTIPEIRRLTASTRETAPAASSVSSVSPVPAPVPQAAPSAPLPEQTSLDSMFTPVETITDDDDLPF